uniref:Large ribosomal subunit protein uL13c n=1 Tax=Periphykon beckeri TaxID=2006982 RepID=A0A1Z1M3S9_9FLOR|nr:ribosomal protein L13 [Periphykon beckeri]ARW60463.1 ribosomal protein L13 [Periphykon beckeri]
MDINKNKTIITTNKQELPWYIIDAKEWKLGRLSSKITYILKNKNSKEYLPYKPGKSKIIIINSQEIKVTGNKIKQKSYKKHSGRPGGLKTETFETLQKKIPNKILEHAIKGMMPKSSLGRKLMKNIKIYPNNKHPHINQKIIKLNIE